MHRLTMTAATLLPKGTPPPWAMDDEVDAWAVTIEIRALGNAPTPAPSIFATTYHTGTGLRRHSKACKDRGWRACTNRTGHPGGCTPRRPSIGAVLESLLLDYGTRDEFRDWPEMAEGLGMLGSADEIRRARALWDAIEREREQMAATFGPELIALMLDHADTIADARGDVLDLDDDGAPVEVAA